jgi:adenine-specific DNA-methyltransferase
MGKDLPLAPTEEGKYDCTWVDRADPRATEIRELEVVQAVGNTSSGKLLAIGHSGDVLRTLFQDPQW